MAKKRGRGGYRRPTPTNKNAVSGPGALSQRTDGAQPVMRLPNAGYGESKAFEEQQQAAPLGDSGGAGAPNLIAPAFPGGTTFAGGGGGMSHPSGTPGTGGAGGGGTGADCGANGTTNLAGGGSGANGNGSSGRTGGTGGPGIVILRFPTASKSPSYAVAPGTNTTATVGSCTVATFTVSGTLVL